MTNSSEFNWTIGAWLCNVDGGHLTGRAASGAAGENRKGTG
jgi:hypothetical protein